MVVAVGGFLASGVSPAVRSVSLLVARFEAGGPPGRKM